MIGTLCQHSSSHRLTDTNLLHCTLQQKGVGLHESLVDPEGYPRSDVDVYSVRHARHQVVCKSNK